MTKNWTEAQQNAMNIRQKTLLVSAAAGSGKTATLTERIIRRITDEASPADISKMLIVTFTRAAAAELRVKIFSALSDAVAQNPSNRHLASQLMKIGSARICTIDSFYFDLIQSNLSTLGLSSSPRIADDSEYLIMASEIMERSIADFYEEYEDFPAFVECFASARQFGALPDIFLDIHNKLQSLPEGIEFLRQCAKRTNDEQALDFFSTTYGKVLQQNTRDILKHYLSVLQSAIEYANNDEYITKAYLPALAFDLDFCKALAAAIEDSTSGYSKIHAMLLDFTPKNLSVIRSENSTPQSVICKDIHTEFKKAVGELSAKGFSKSPETIARAMSDTAKYTEIMYKLLYSFEERTEAEKSRLCMLTFSDIRRLTLKLLVNKDGSPTAVALQYKEQFSDIYIDEYQDVDKVQDMIFCSIARPDNRFMVGDIKQSIYEFRGADPSVFAHYRAKFPLYNSDEAKNSNSVSVFMSNNFRCDQTIIDFANLVCSKIFSVAADSIGYTEEDNLKFSKVYSHDNYSPTKVKLVIVKSPSRAEKLSDSRFEGASAHDYEAQYIANEIERLLRDGVKENGEPIAPSDICVMFRKSSIAPFVSEALKKRGILCSEEDASQYFENPDVLTVLCILNAVDNPERDIFLAGALKSPIFDFSMDELIKLRTPYDERLSLYGSLCRYAEDFEDALSEKCSHFKNTLEHWQSEAASMPIDRFLLTLFDSPEFLCTGIVSHSNCEGEGGNLLLLYEYARKFENGSFKGLYQFIEYVNSVIEKGKTIALGEAAHTKNRVSLMTVHKSKGLEFPVCFLCGTSSSNASEDTKDSLVFDSDCGVAMKVSESTGMAQINTPMREAVISKIATRQAEEEMRILYVALTRARERLYVTASSAKAPEEIMEQALSTIEHFDRYTVIKKCSSYLDWILLACKNCENPIYEFEFVPLQPIDENTATKAEALLDDSLDANDTELEQKLKEKFSFQYDYSELSSIPSKISVSRLYPDVLDYNNDSLELFTEPKKAEVPSFFTGEAPKKAGAAERGTVTHLFLQFCDFALAHENGVENELARLIHKGFLPKNAAELVYINELDAFLKSGLFDQIRSASRIIREQRFNIRLSADGFTKNPKLLSKLQNEGLAVQGVVDIILVDTDGSVSLFDYKTDRLSREELENPSLAKQTMQQRHGLQLSYYAKAAELLFGKPCKRIAIFSTCSSLLYDIDFSIGESANLF